MSGFLIFAGGYIVGGLCGMLLACFMIVGDDEADQA